MTPEPAQIAKIELALGELGLQPACRLEIGRGWGATRSATHTRQRNAAQFE